MELVDKLRIDITYMLTSHIVANPIGGYATLGVKCSLVELDLSWFNFIYDLHMFEYEGFVTTHDFQHLKIMPTSATSNYKCRKTWMLVINLQECSIIHYACVNS